MEDVINALALIGVIVTIILLWLGGERAIYWWRNRHNKE